jgi:hypothetical protein
MVREGNSPPALVITCVHGTWGRGFFSRRTGSQKREQPLADPSTRFWFEPGSAFRQNLEQALQDGGLHAAFDYFEWSGDNSVLQRDEAGKALAEHLRSQSERFPGQAKVVIAHSHGGNVAMRALRRLVDAGEMIRIVTLATPFVEVFYTPGDKLDELSSRILGVAAATPLLFLGYALSISKWVEFSFIALAGFAVIGRRSTVARWCFVAVLAVLTLDYVELGALTFLLPVVAVGWFAPLAKGAAAVGHWFIGPFASLGRASPRMDASARRLTQASALRPMRSPPRRLLVLRGVDDEAALTLGAGAVGARLSRVLVAILTRLETVIVWTVVTLAISTAVASFIFGMLHYSPLEGALKGGIGSRILFLVYCVASVWSIGFLTVLLVWLPIAMIFTALVCCVLKGVHGRELLHGSVVLDVVSNSVPDCLGDVDTITLPHDPRARRGLRHALYNHPDVARLIVGWLSARPEGAGTEERFESFIDQ